MKRITLLIIFLKLVFTCFVTFAQTLDIQKLAKKLDTYSKSDTTKIRLLTQLAWEKYYFNQDTMLILLNQGLTIAEKLKDKKVIGLANREFVYYYAYYNLKEFDKALEFGQKALKLIEASPDKAQIAFTLLDIGHLYSLKHQHQEALNYYFKALKIYENLKNNEYSIYTYMDIKSTYEKLNQKEKTTEYERKINQMIEKIKDKKQLAKIYLCTGMANILKSKLNLVLENLLNSEKVYNEISDIKLLRFTTTLIAFTYHILSKSINDESAGSKSIYYYQKLLAIIKKDNNQVFNSTPFQDKVLGFYMMPIGVTMFAAYEDINAYNMMGFTLSFKSRNIDKALAYHLKAKDLAEKRNDKFGLDLSADGLGQINMFQGKYQEAIDYFLKSNRADDLQKLYIAQCYQKLGKLKESLQYALQADKGLQPGGNRYWLYTSNNLLAEVYGELKQYEQAYIYQKIAKRYDDSLRVKENMQKVGELEKKQAVTLLEKDKQIQAQVNHNQRLWLFSSLGALFSVLIVAFILYRNNQNKQKANKLLSEQKEEIKATLSIVEQERQKSDKLLLNILPEETAQELKEKGSATPQHYELVSVLFTDFKGFTQAVENLKPIEVIQELDFCFNHFDEIVEKYGLERIKTIGDAYMAVGGLPVANQTNPIDAVKAGLEIQAFMNNLKQQREAEGKTAWQCRLGIHSGEVIAGVVGTKKFAYDIWGDTVNSASRMESSGEVGKVNISGATYQLIKDQFQCKYRGKIEAKNKGEVEMYFVEKVSINSITD